MAGRRAGADGKLMAGLRGHLLRHRLLFAWLAAAFAMKLLIPAGFMPVMTASAIAIEFCDGYEPLTIAASPAMAGKQGSPHHQGGAAMPCPFAMLSAPGLAGVDPVQLVAATAFVMALMFLAMPVRACRHVARPHPHLRGPPLLI